MEQWTVSQASFDRLLAVLDSDRDIAGEKYEALRIRIVKFFEWRVCATPDEMADMTLDRIARKIVSGEDVGDPVKYAYGVARFLYLENRKQMHREEPIVSDIAYETLNDEDEERRMTCLEHCLGKLSDDSRGVILGYYCEDRQAKIDNRKKIAEELGISANALRLKSLRIRATLEDCVLKCINKVHGHATYNASINH
jgi:DNA-directed RNA polymerase specialized sigma24 family protein